MTTVVGYADGHHVWLAADSQTNVYERPVTGTVKVIRLPVGEGEGEALLGFSGSLALAQLAAARLAGGLPGMGLYGPAANAADEWALNVAARLTELAKDHDLFTDGRMDSTALLGSSGRLWTLVHHAAVAHPDGYAAVGSGEGPAIGALIAIMEGADPPEPAEAIVRAVAVACRTDKHSGLPVILHMS